MMKSKILFKTPKALNDLSQISLLISPSAIPSSHSLDSGYNSFLFLLIYTGKVYSQLRAFVSIVCPTWHLTDLHATTSFLGLKVSVQYPHLREVFSDPTFPYLSHLPLILPHCSLYFQSMIPLGNHLVYLYVCSLSSLTNCMLHESRDFGFLGCLFNPRAQNNACHLASA